MPTWYEPFASATARDGAPKEIPSRHTPCPRRTSTSTGTVAPVTVPNTTMLGAMQSHSAVFMHAASGSITSMAIVLRIERMGYRLGGCVEYNE